MIAPETPSVLQLESLRERTQALLGVTQRIFSLLTTKHTPPQRQSINSASGSVFDFHQRYDVLPYAIKSLQAAGYDLVTVAECLGIEPYIC